jgi:hypothetical protein
MLPLHPVALVAHDFRGLSEPSCGRRVCAFCEPPRDMGPAPGLAFGDVTHGICAACATAHFGCPETFTGHSDA